MPISASSRYKTCVVCYRIHSNQRRANRINPLRDGSEKSEGFPRGARETMLARYKRRRLGVSGWHDKRKALGVFGHVTWQASGWDECEAGERVV